MTRAILAVLLPIFYSNPVVAQSTQLCAFEPHELVMPGGLSYGDEYGKSMAVTGRWLFVGAPLDDQLSSSAGAVYVFELDGEVYEFRQKLLASGGVGPARFGFSLAARDDVLIVGAENDREITQTQPNAWGAAYLFRLQDDAWIQQQKLFAFGAGEANQHGYAVAVMNDVAVVGAKQVFNDGVFGKGAAYIYRYEGTKWLDEQRLTAPAPSSGDWFGTALEITAETLLVGSPRNADQGSNSGAVFAFAEVGQEWILHSTLYALNPGPTQQFGTSMDTDGNGLVATAPTDGSGSVHVFQWNGARWNFETEIVPASPFNGTAATVAVAGDLIVIGAPQSAFSVQQFQYSQAGLTLVYERIRNVWMRTRQLSLWQGVSPWPGYAPYLCWLNSPQPDSTWPQSPASGQLGISTAVGPIGILAGSMYARSTCWPPPLETNATGAVNLFPFQAPWSDCNADYVPDSCPFGTIDCNGNDVADECDIAVPNGDCNDNSVPDDCEAGFTYKLNDQNAQYVYWVNSVNGNADYIWLNEFRVAAGGQVLTHISLHSTDWLPPGTPVKALLYSDPNQDGDPNDAQLLASVETTALSHDSYYYGYQMVNVAIPPTYIGEPGTFFFIGGVLHCLYLSGPTDDGWAAMATKSGAHFYRRALGEHLRHQGRRTFMI